MILKPTPEMPEQDQ